MRKGSLAHYGHVLLLALPWIVLALWLAFAVAPFSHSRALREILAALLIASACVLAGRSLGWRGGWLALLVWFALLVVGFADAISWFLQASSFNEGFFAHFNTDNLGTALQVMPMGTLLVIIGLAACLALGIVVLRHAIGRRLRLWWLVPALALLYVGLRIDAPPRRLVQYLQHVEQTRQDVGSAAGDEIRAMVNGSPSQSDSVQASPGRNVVWVYLESIERTYLDEQRFPGLMPAVNRMRSEGLDFTGFHTFPGATYTISGLFASQCGAPFLINSIFGTANTDELHFVPGNDATTRESFHPQLACFGDVLHAAGYDQTILSGADLDFTDKRQLFTLHGYDHTLGSHEIQALHGGTLPTAGWGLNDDDLYQQALATYREKAGQDQPFSLVVETVDTHRPEGVVTPGCRPYTAIDNPMLDAVHCADQLLENFLEQLSREPGFENTLVVVMGDHIAMYNTASKLYPPDEERQPFLMVLNAGTGERAARMYHMDVAPTVLSLMGVETDIQFMAGEDRGKPDSTDTPIPDSKLAVEVLRKSLWKQQPRLELCRGGDLIHWNGQGLQINDTHIPVKVAGYNTDHIPDSRTLVVFIGQHSAQAQIMPRGTEREWTAKAGTEGRSVFKATPFWNDAGERRLALDWIAPNGAWASLGQVHDGSQIQLSSPHCRRMLSSLRRGGPGQRFDFSQSFGLEPLAADRQPAPGVVRMRQLPADTNPEINATFMFDNITARRRGYGAIRLNRNERIFMHPGPTHAAWAEFDVSRVASLVLEPRINPLVGSCITQTDTGIVGVSVSLDGEPEVPRFIVDRDYEGAVTLDTRRAKTLRVTVDKGNETMSCDWFAMIFPHLELMDDEAHKTTLSMDGTH